MKTIATPYSLFQTIQSLKAQITALQSMIGSGAGATRQVFSGSADPNGTQEATGSAIYLRTNTTPPTVYFKTSSGTSNNEWQ